MSKVAKGLQRGSRRAWGQLYDAYAERLWREVARMMGSDAAEVADVVQETFLAAARSARQFDPARGTLWGWLRGIARRQIATRYRKQASQLEKLKSWWAGSFGNGNSSADVWLAGTADGPSDVLKVLESKELAELVGRALLELPGHYQDLLTRRYFEGESAVEIAAEAGESAAAVRARLMRARKAFRDEFTRLTRLVSKDIQRDGEVTL